MGESCTVSLDFEVGRVQYIDLIGVGDARRLGVQETFAQLFPRNARKPCRMRLAKVDTEVFQSYISSENAVRRCDLPIVAH